MTDNDSEIQEDGPDDEATENNQHTDDVLGALQAQARVPDPSSISQSVLDELVGDAAYRGGKGDVATYIPELRMALWSKLGLSLCFATGVVLNSGDATRCAREANGAVTEEKRAADDSFTIQSISKIFALLYVLDRIGHDAVFKRVDKEPTGDAFNETPRLRKNEDRRIPYNPLINAGAILITSLFEDARVESKPGNAFDQFKAFVEDLCGVERGELLVDEAVFRSERATGHGNRALAWRMSADEVFYQRDSSAVRVTGHDELSERQLAEDKERRVREVDFVEQTLDNYFRQCSILVTCKHLAIAAGTLANGGVVPGSDRRLLAARDVRTVVALMSSCGMYDGSGEFSHDVGIPSKSGVGGGIMSVVPGQLGIAAYSPMLDGKGNSVRGIYMLKWLANEYGLSIFSRSYSSPALSVFQGNDAIDRLTSIVRSASVPPEGCRKQDYIPELGAANAQHIAMSICYVDEAGKICKYSGGDSTVRFSMQSIGSLFALLYALERHSEPGVFEFVGKEPTGLPFSSMKETKQGWPFNPMINEGAIILATLIPDTFVETKSTFVQSEAGHKEEVEMVAIDKYLRFVRLLCGNHQIEVNWRVFHSESRTGFKNRSIAWTMNDLRMFSSLENRFNVSVDAEFIEKLMSVYFRMCSVEVTCEDLAHAGAVLANGGVSLDGKQQIVHPRHASIATAMMSSTGLFDGSGEFAYAVGIPSKTGVSGGILGVAPGRLGVAAYNPIVDEKGNTYYGQILLERLARLEGLSIFGELDPSEEDQLTGSAR